MINLVWEILSLLAAIFCGASGFIQLDEKNWGWGVLLLLMCLLNVFAFVARLNGLIG